MPRTVSAIRGALYTRLTSPPLTYTIDQGAPLTLPATSVFPRAVYEPGPHGSNVVFPAAFIDVRSGAPVSRHLLNVLKVSGTIWAVSSVGPSEATAIADAISARLDFADDDPIWQADDMSADGTGAKLPILFHQWKRTRYSGAGYESTTNKWYVTMEYDGVVQ